MCYKQLTLEQRYQIKAFLTAGYSVSKISNVVKTHRSTIYRELHRNGTARSYQPKLANERAVLRRRYSKKKRKLTPEMKVFIRNKLREYWSPEQIYGYCKKHGIEMISHESLYRYIAKNKSRGGLLYRYLRRGKKRKRSYGSLHRAQNIKNRVSIEQRPDIVDKRERIGDWEADLIIGKNHCGALLTIVERYSRYTCSKLLCSKNAKEVASAIVELLTPVKRKVYTITFDNGSEFALHENVSAALEADVYFAHPYSSWERGANENINGLIRQFIPKGVSFDGLTNGYVDKITKNLNSRPKKTLNFDLPENVFWQEATV